METARGPPAASLPRAGRLVFAGSAERDVAFAKAFWDSVTLQPPLESCLGRAGPRPRQTQRNIAFQIPPGNNKSEQIILEAQKAEEKEKYLQKAMRRDEILALLWKQREERITKEQISCLHKPKTKTHQVRAKISDSDTEDQETVKALE
ncbi:cilia- and flagella-associated protein HOATZ isoform X2 [Caretta caretta]|uniref:cilia- and flagella-associated protein HOATZ isoform X2 n=1 Tax=Caretta caretta TaxID=8467 RepID=UPI002095AF43|nr:cilia- and flagella-associated protein HOATZ isoform X2 [Caretta caretta]